MTSSLLQPSSTTSSSSSPLRLVCIEWTINKPLGLHLSRSPWDPYPWCDVQQKSIAYEAGIRSGDCLLEVNGDDILGKRIIEVANKIKENSGVSLLLWNAGTDHVSILINRDTHRHTRHH